MIEIDDVSVTFGSTRVLESITASIEDGRFVGLVGPNGAGKTTLLRTISGVCPPDSGRVRIDGDDVTTFSAKQRGRVVAVVPQDTHLAFSFTVRHLVSMGRTPYRSRFAPPDERDRACVDRALERTGTTDLASRSVDELSGGERQRVLLARALAQETPVVLLDEPTASLDVNHQVEMLSVARRLTGDGTTVVAAIHDLDLAARFCDELLVVANGKLVRRGPPDDVIDAETIEATFGATAAVTPDPVTWSPRVTTVTDDGAAHTLPDHVHVIGTGRATADVLTTVAGSTDCSLGPVPRSDAAAVTASSLDVEYDPVDPLRPLSDRAIERCRGRLETAGAVVLVPGGPLDAYASHWQPILSDRPTVVLTDVDGTDHSPMDRTDSPCQTVETDRSGLLDALETVALAPRLGPEAVRQSDD
ncbi:ABC transporter ATP-binding protein [Halovivax limisalsi]|uniref:ABC transporter ATP-binding protein n=1 Tax=Halovivax limisalsi TaxID=1453760 RepID=UPI001FFC3896|nr:ATP-binding cassette domain-containing protein [Halovivax limisalsi]